jgi:CheY-like chemotaxis protein
VVDDDLAVREATCFVLGDEGYEVLEAPDGVEALERLRSADGPLVVLLDILMPRATGIDVFSLVGGDKRLARHEYIIWAASQAPLGVVLDSLGVPVLHKPFDLNDLLALVAEAAERLERKASA